MITSAVPEYQVVVIGGGPAGCAAAIALAGSSLENILLVEQGDYSDRRVGETIPPDTRVLFTRLGLWEAFLEEGHDVCYGSFASWGSDEPGYNDFLFNPHGTGWHLDRGRFDAFLMQRADKLGVEVRTNTHFRNAQSDRADSYLLRLDEAGVRQHVRARFVIDATGYRATFAKNMGSTAEVVDRIICVYGFFSLNAASTLSKMTMLEATRDGWWYAARLPGGTAAAAFAVDPETVRNKALRQEQGWLRSLGETVYIAPALQEAAFLRESLVIKPALSLIRKPVAGSNWLSVGDAAAVYDPISAQGVYKALLDGIRAGQTVGSLIDGRTPVVSRYAADVRNRFNDFLLNQTHLYGLERRWADSPFWRRRRQSSRAAVQRAGLRV